MAVSLALRMAVCAALLVRWSAPEAADAAGIERCRALNQSAERLLCYDSLFPRVPASSGSSAPQPLPARPPDRSSDEGVHTPTASGQAPEDANRTFGLSGAGERAVKGISATVTELQHEPGGRFVVYLDNGQVWRQIESDDWTPPRKGERVRIRRAALGSYMLETAENLATHVTRIR
ncbi:MAG TPA: hypothetical protein VIX87_04225 [Steroidobacteraceae bacterium]